MDDENKVMPDLIEPLIGPVRTTNPDSVMKNKVIEGSKNIASFLQCGMPQLRLPISRMSNPDIQKLMHDIRKNAKQKPNAAERRAAKIAKGELRIEDGKLVGIGQLRNDNASIEQVEKFLGVGHPDNDPDFDWAALQRLRKSGEGLY